MVFCWYGLHLSVYNRVYMNENKKVIWWQRNSECDILLL